MDLGSSAIIEIDPVSGIWSTIFRGSKDIPFYTRTRGNHQILENGNLLVTVANSGRILELSPDGRLVWEFKNIYDATRNGILSMAEILPVDFFDPGALSCPEAAATGAG